MTSGQDRFRLLTVCTANQCRSPMAEVIAEQLLAQRGVDADVSSCGQMEGGMPATVGAIRAVARRGLDLSAHRSRTMDARIVGDADLIVTMERRHIVAVGDLCLDAIRRTFTLLELADLAAMVGPRRHDQEVASWIAAADGMRAPTAVLSFNVDDDLEDPMGGPRSAFRVAADRIEDRLQVIFDALFPS